MTDDELRNEVARLSALVEQQGEWLKRSVGLIQSLVAGSAPLGKEACELGRELSGYDTPRTEKQINRGVAATTMPGSPGAVMIQSRRDVVAAAESIVRSVRAGGDE